MSAESIATAERNDRFSSVVIGSSISLEEQNRLPHPRFCGSEGPETVSPVGIYEEGSATRIVFESWVFGLKDDQVFLSYCRQVLGHLGSTATEIDLRVAPSLEELRTTTWG